MSQSDKQSQSVSQFGISHCGENTEKLTSDKVLQPARKKSKYDCNTYRSIKTSWFKDFPWLKPHQCSFYMKKCVNLPKEQICSPGDMVKRERSEDHMPRGHPHYMQI